MFAGNAFGGDAGNQFAGGGFMPSQANDTGYGGGGGSGGGKKSGSSTLRTLTIRQLAKELNNADDDTHIVDGVELANVTVIGRILNVMDRGNNLFMTITDGTGEMEVVHFLQEDNGHAMQARKAELRPGVYVKAHGHIRTFEKKPNLNAFNMRVITNFNEVTYHYLRAIFEHLHLTKGAAAGQGMPPAAAAAAAGGGFGGPAAGGWGGAPQQQQGGAGATAFAGAGGGEECMEAMLEVIRSANTSEGMHVEQVYNTLAGRFPKARLEQTLQMLINDAHIYTTSDDYHYAAA